MIDAKDLDSYARVVAGTAAGLGRAELLADVGLEEASFELLSERVEAELSRAMSAVDGSVPPFLVAYEAALRKAHLALAGTTRLSVEDFARALNALERGGDPKHALAKLGVTPEELSRAALHFGPLLAKDRSLMLRFMAVRGGS